MWYRNLACGGLALVLTAATGLAGTEEKTVETKRGMPESAASVNFARELGVGTPSLKLLGSQIEAARDAADPVALATLARELAALEKASGKTASVNSESLAKEAVELARHRDISVELKAVALLLPEHKGAQELNELAEKAETRESAAKAAVEHGGEKAKGIQGTLYVINKSSEDVRLYIDGHYKGVVQAYTVSHLYIGQGPYETTFLDGRGSAGGVFRRQIQTPVDDFYWTLTD